MKLLSPICDCVCGSAHVICVDVRKSEMSASHLCDEMTVVRQKWSMFGLVIRSNIIFSVVVVIDT